MAQVPNSEEVKEAQFATELEINQKRADQEAQGKGFIVPEDGHGPGVVPEDVWQGHKEQDNG